MHVKYNVGGRKIFRSTGLGDPSAESLGQQLVFHESLRPT